MRPITRRGFWALLAILLASPSFAAHTLRQQHRAIVTRWLQQHPNLRLASTSDCRFCADNIATMRRGIDDEWKPVPDYDPYRAVGDFNGDGYIDFAVVVIDTKKSKDAFALVIFNGPFTSDTASPAFLEENLDLSNQGLFFGPPRPKPYRLVVGEFESDNSGILEPAGGYYRWIHEDD